jgi:hypothetical protein
LQSDWLKEDGKPEDGLGAVLARTKSDAAFQRRDPVRLRMLRVSLGETAEHRDPPQGADADQDGYWTLDDSVGSVNLWASTNGLTVDPSGVITAVAIASPDGDHQDV